MLYVVAVTVSQRCPPQVSQNAIQMAYTAGHQE